MKTVGLLFCVGERGRNRTYNLVIKSHLLCQLSYAPQVCGYMVTHQVRRQF
jgi:hypothetical protein